MGGESRQISRSTKVCMRLNRILVGHGFNLLSVCHDKNLEQSSCHPAAGDEAEMDCRVANGLVGDACQGEQSRREVGVVGST